MGAEVPVEARVVELDQKVLNSAEAGLALAGHVSSLIHEEMAVELDFWAVDRMTPSFANALVMTLMAEFDESELRARCRFVNQSEAIQSQLVKSADRFRRGIRLSTQRAA